MSSVTDVILLCAGLDDVAWERVKPSAMVRVDQHAGGSKGFEAAMYVGAFNYFGYQEFLDSVDEVDWILEERLCLITRSEHSDRPTVRYSDTILRRCEHGRRGVCPICVWLAELKDTHTKCEACRHWRPSSEPRCKSPVCDPKEAGR